MSRFCKYRSIQNEAIFKVHKLYMEKDTGDNSAEKNKTDWSSIKIEIIKGGIVFVITLVTSTISIRCQNENLIKSRTFLEEDRVKDEANKAFKELSEITESRWAATNALWSALYSYPDESKTIEGYVRLYDNNLLTWNSNSIRIVSLIESYFGYEEREYYIKKIYNPLVLAGSKLKREAKKRLKNRKSKNLQIPLLDPSLKIIRNDFIKMHRRLIGKIRTNQILIPLN